MNFFIMVCLSFICYIFMIFVSYWAMYFVIKLDLPCLFPDLKMNYSRILEAFTLKPGLFVMLIHTILFIVFMYYVNKLFYFMLFSWSAEKEVFSFSAHAVKELHFKKFYRHIFQIFYLFMFFFMFCYKRVLDTSLLALFAKWEMCMVDYLKMPKPGFGMPKFMGTESPWNWEKLYHSDMLTCFNFLSSFLPEYFFVWSIIFGVLIFLIVPLAYLLTYKLEYKFMHDKSMIRKLERFLVFLKWFYIILTSLLCLFFFYNFVLIMLSKKCGFFFSVYPMHFYHVLLLRLEFVDFNYTFMDFNTFSTTLVNKLREGARLKQTSLVMLLQALTVPAVGIWYFFMVMAFFTVLKMIYNASMLIFLLNPNDSNLSLSWKMKLFSSFIYFLHFILFLYFVAIMLSGPGSVPPIVVLIYQSLF